MPSLVLCTELKTIIPSYAFCLQLDNKWLLLVVTACQFSLVRSFRWFESSPDFISVNTWCQLQALLLHCFTTCSKILAKIICPRYSGRVTQDLQMDIVYATWNAITAAVLKFTDMLDHLWPPPCSLRGGLFPAIYSSNFYLVSHGGASLRSLWKGGEQGNGPRSCMTKLYVRKEYVLMTKD